MAQATPTETQRTSAEPAPRRNAHLATIAATIPLGLFAALYLNDLAPSAFLVPALVLSIPALIFVVLAHVKRRPWMILAAGLAATLQPILVLGVFGAWRGLAGPHAAPLVVATLLVGVAALAVPHGILGFRAARSGISGDATRRIAYVALVGGILLGTLYAGSVFRAVETQGGLQAYDVAPDGVATLTMKDFAFASTSPLRAGELTEILLQNQDPEAHTFTYESGGRTYNHEVPGNTEARVLVRFDAAGTVPYRCLPHPGMDGELVVEAAAAP